MREDFWSAHWNEMLLAWVLIPALLGFLIFTLIYRDHLRIGVLRALTLALAVAVGGAAWLTSTKAGILAQSPLFRGPEIYATHAAELGAMWAFFVGLACATGIVAKIFCVAILGIASEQERAGGQVAFRAWLTPLGLVLTAGAVGGLYMGAGWSVPGSALLALATLLVYPAMNSFVADEAPQRRAPAEDVAEDRRRVLAMVESGKISGEGAAELIGALGQSHELQGGSPAAAVSRNRVLMLLGAAVLLVGFFLPYEKVDLGDALRNTVLPGALSMFQGSGAATAPFQFMPQGPSIEISARAGDIHYGLGWIFLALGLAAAILPLVWPQRPTNRQLQSGISLAALLAGSIILVYIASEVFTGGTAVHIQAGLILMIAAYALMWLGLAREYLRHGVPALRPALAA